LHTHGPTKPLTATRDQSHMVFQRYQHNFLPVFWL
jgi:hypothetical protein